MVIKWEVEIKGTTDPFRTAYVYLPVGYDGHGGNRYPVMYMFDGQNLFSDSDATYGKSWGMADYLDRTETPLIVAAVSCNTKGNGRLSEYSPVDFTFRSENIKGSGKAYMDWFCGTFKQYIDENFLTLPDRKNTAVGGSSMGGLMTLYALSKYGKYFSKGAALSPSLWVSGGSVVPFIERASYRKDVIIYTDYGSREFSNHDGQRAAFADACAVLIKKGVHLTSRIIPGGVHNEASWEKQIPFFLPTLGFKPNFRG